VVDEDERSLMIDGGKEVVKVDREMSDDDSGATDMRTWTDCLVNPIDIALFEHDDEVRDWLAHCHL
jgi:hypothetical protein